MEIVFTTPKGYPPMCSAPEFLLSMPLARIAKIHRKLDIILKRFPKTYYAQAEVYHD